MAAFVSVQNKKEEMNKLSQYLKSPISGLLEAILLNFCMWTTKGGCHIRSKNCFILLKQHRATIMWKS